jgi:hypothetical protein
LLVASPIVVPDDEFGFVTQSEAGTQPAVAKIAVFRWLFGTEPLVKAADGESHGLAHHHVIRKEDTDVELASVVVSTRIIFRRRYC